MKGEVFVDAGDAGNSRCSSPSYSRGGMHLSFRLQFDAACSTIYKCCEWFVIRDITSCAVVATFDGML